MDQTRAWNYSNETILVEGDGGGGSSVLGGFLPFSGTRFWIQRFILTHWRRVGEAPMLRQVSVIGRGCHWLEKSITAQNNLGRKMVGSQIDRRPFTLDSPSGLRRGTWPETQGEEAAFLAPKRQASGGSLWGTPPSAHSDRSHKRMPLVPLHWL